MEHNDEKNIIVRKNKRQFLGGKHISTIRKPFVFKKRFIMIIISVIVIVIVLINTGLYPTMLALSKAKVGAVATEAMLSAISECFLENTKYVDIVESFDNGNKVYMLSADTIQMNNLAAECAINAQETISKHGDIGIFIAFGTITEIPILAGIGPKIKIKFSPEGSVQAEFLSTLTSSGINQTLYKVSIVLTAKVYIVLPGISHSIDVVAHAAIAECVIVGDVPQVYTNVANEEDLLNLIPSEAP